jgi:hypothetical protein
MSEPSNVNAPDNMAEDLAPVDVAQPVHANVVAREHVEAVVEPTAGEPAANVAEVVDEPLNQVFDQVTVSVEAALSPAGLDFEASGGIAGHPPAAVITNPLSLSIRDVLTKVFDFYLPSVGRSIPCTFANVNCLVINLDALVPSFFANPESLWHLANILCDPLDVPQIQVSSAWDGPSKDEVHASDDDLILLVKMPSPKAPRKHRAKRCRSPLDSMFLRCSVRIGKYMKVYKNKEDVDATTEGGAADLLAIDAPVAQEKMQGAVDEPVPLAVIPAYEGVGAVNAPSATPPLPPVTLQAIRTGFLGMQPEDVSVAALPASDDE